MDVSKLIIAKSDQLNADDLIAGAITVQITGVTKGNSEQPVNIKISGGHMAFRPSKTALRVLVAAWGFETDVWVGRWMTLFRDPKVKWAGEPVGGIRISALSHIDGPLTLALAESKGKKSPHRIAVLRPDQAKQSGAPTANLDALLADNKLTRADVDRWLEANGKPRLDADPEKVPALAAWLAADEARLTAIRALIPTTDAPAREPGEE